MKQVLKICFFYLFTTNIIGQIQMKGNVSFPPNEYKAEKLEEIIQSIYYNYLYASNPKKKQKTKSSLTILQVGENYSKFTDIYMLKQDSLYQVFSKMESIGAKEMNLMFPLMNKIGFKKNVIKHFKNNSLIFQGNVHSTRYEYEEKKPNLKWKLERSHKSILSYKVKKATVNYGGRKWIAWYTEQIPINLGPYVFGNLPGLILEVYDDKKNFHFLATGVNNKPQEIYKRVESRIIKTTKEKFFKAERNFHEKPELFVRGVTRGVVNFKKIPYNPIEIID